MYKSTCTSINGVLFSLLLTQQIILFAHLVVLCLLVERFALLCHWLLVTKVMLSLSDPVQEFNQRVNSLLSLLL